MELLDLKTGAYWSIGCPAAGEEIRGVGELKGNQREWDGRMIRVAAKMHLECSRASYDPIRTADGMTIQKKAVKTEGQPSLCQCYTRNPHTSCWQAGDLFQRQRSTWPNTSQEPTPVLSLAWPTNGEAETTPYYMIDMNLRLECSRCYIA